MECSPPIRCLLPGDAIGFIIGKAGATIKQITDETGARIDLIKENDAPHTLSDKICIIQGSEEGKKGALRMILQKLWLAQSFTEKDPAVMVLMVPQNGAGGIVGARGAIITDICTHTGSEINMGKDAIVGLRDRPCAVTGQLHQVLEAIMCIQKLLADMVKENKLTGNDFVLNGMYGSPFEMSKQTNDVGNGVMSNGMPVGNSNNSSVDIGSNSNNSGGAGTNFGAGTNNTTNSFFSGGNSFVNTTANTMGERNDRSQAINPKQALNSVVKVVVTADIAAWIIGKGGSHIQDMQQKTGAQVDIKDGVPPVLPGDKVIHISGTFEAKIEGILMIINAVDSKPSGVPLESQMLVPAEKVKYLIGKQGSAINHVKNQSGANIDFPRDAPGVGMLEDKIMTLQGTVDQRAKAGQVVFTRLEELLMDEEGIPRVQDGGRFNDGRPTTHGTFSFSSTNSNNNQGSSNNTTNAFFSSSSANANTTTSFGDRKQFSSRPETSAVGGSQRPPQTQNNNNNNIGNASGATSSAPGSNGNNPYTFQSDKNANNSSGANSMLHSAGTPHASSSGSHQYDTFHAPGIQGTMNNNNHNNNNIHTSHDNVTERSVVSQHSTWNASIGHGASQGTGDHGGFQSSSVPAHGGQENGGHSSSISNGFPQQQQQQQQGQHGFQTNMSQNVSNGSGTHNPNYNQTPSFQSHSGPPSQQNSSTLHTNHMADNNGPGSFQSNPRSFSSNNSLGTYNNNNNNNNNLSNNSDGMNLGPSINKNFTSTSSYPAPMQHTQHRHEDEAAMRFTGNNNNGQAHAHQNGNMQNMHLNGGISPKLGTGADSNSAEQAFMRSLHASGGEPCVQLVVMLPLKMMQTLYEQGQITEIAQRANCPIECEESEGDCQVTLRGTPVSNSLACLYLQEKLLIF